MIRFCLTTLFIAVCESTSGGYGGSSGGGGYGGSSGGGGYGGIASVINVGKGGINAVTNTGPIPAAIQSSHTVEIQTVDIPYNPVAPQVIEVDAQQLPLTIHFKSASSNINVVQTHQPGQVGEHQQTSSEDEPHHLLHEVTKPIIQEVREVITPYRRVVQEIRPVQEEIQTIVARGEPRQHQMNNLDYNGFNGGFNGGQRTISGGYGGGSGGGGYGGSNSGGTLGLLGGSVSILGDSGSSTGTRTTGSPALSSFSSSDVQKKSKSDGSGARNKDYSKSS